MAPPPVVSGRASSTFLLHAFFSVVLVAFTAAFTTPARAQSLGEPPPQRLRHIAEVQLLGGRSAGAFTPSFRATLQRRRSLGTAVTISGLFLQDDLSHTGGLVLGYAGSLPAGPIAVEPFGEVGAGLTDARVSTGSYTILEPSGAERTLERYRAVEGSAVIGGAGVSFSGLVGGATSARLTVGYWHVAGANGLSRGSVRFGLSLGVGRRDGRWYALATDRTPPTVLVRGRAGTEADSVALTDGVLTVLSADANGVARVAVDGRELTLQAADRSELQRSGLPETGVSASVTLDAPFGGLPVLLVTRDSAGLETTARLRAFGPADRDPPVLTVVPSDPQSDQRPGEHAWPFQILAEDYSGIAEARLGVCSVSVSYPNPATRGGDFPPTLRMIRGFEGIGAGNALVVTDRSGNQSRFAVTQTSPTIPTGAALPELLLATPNVAAGRAGSRNVFVVGSVRDPAGGWIRGVTVAGVAAGLRVPVSPSIVEFRGWVTVPATETSVVVEAVTSDGRRVRQTLALGPEEGRSAGRTHVLIARASDEGRAAWERVAAIAEEEDRVVLLGAEATADRVVAALVRIQQSAGPDDVVFIHLAGTLTADVTAARPSVTFGGGQIQVTYLSRLIRSLPPAATLLSYDLAPGYDWQSPLADAPGGPAPPGCLEIGDLPAGRSVVLGPVTPSRLDAALSGEADQDADGIVTVLEMLDFLGVAAPAGVVAHRPDAVVTDVRRGG